MLRKHLREQTYPEIKQKTSGARKLALRADLLTNLKLEKPIDVEFHSSLLILLQVDVAKKALSKVKTKFFD